MLFDYIHQFSQTVPHLFLNVDVLQSKYSLKMHFNENIEFKLFTNILMNCKYSNTAFIKLIQKTKKFLFCPK